MKKLLTPLSTTIAGLLIASGLMATQVHAQAAQDLVLQGNWTLTWLESGNRNEIRIPNAKTTNGITEIYGASTVSGSELCPTEASIWERGMLTLPSISRPAQTIGVSSYIVFRMNCSDVVAEIHAFGTPNNPTAMVGRATMTFKATNQIKYEAVLIGRPN
jgi:hypothetical protein